MSSVNDSPNHLVVFDTISRGMKSVGMLAKGFFGGRTERNLD